MVLGVIMLVKGKDGLPQKEEVALPQERGFLLVKRRGAHVQSKGILSCHEERG